MMTGIRSDLTQMLTLQRQSRDLSSALDIATQELSTGRKVDVVAATGGDLTRLHTLDTRLSQLQSDRDAIDLFDRRAELADTALAGIQAMVEPIGTDLQAAAISGDAGRAMALARDAASRLDGVIGILNNASGGRALFAGARTDGPAVASENTLMTALRASLVGVADEDAAISAFFADGGTYEATIWQGQTQGAAPTLSTGARLARMPDANSSEIRTALEGLARAALSITSDDPIAAQSAAGQKLSQGTRDIISLREDLGADRFRLEIMNDLTKSEQTVTSLARSTLTSADPHETAARLQGLEAQLQALYVVTARLSSLSIVNFLR